MNKYLSYIVTFMVGVITSTIFCLCATKCNKSEPQPVILKDTIIINKETIKWKEKVIYSTKYDTLIVYNNDTVTDTIKVELPLTTKLYSDSIVTDSSKIHYGAIYSGFKTTLDSMWIDYTFTPKITSKKQNKWGKSIGVGFQCGIGGQYDILTKQMGFGPYFGVGVSYQWSYNW